MCLNNFSPYTKQTWTVSGVLICMVGCSFQLGYVSTLLTDLRQPDSPIKVDLNTASWLASCIGLTFGVGAFLSSALMAWIGRRMTMIVCIIPGIVCWLFIYYAQDITVLMFGRALGGITTGGISYLGAVFIGECTCPKLRGMYLALKTTSICVGALIIHLLGMFLHYKPLALICFVVQTISIVLITMSPESPHWLASKKRYKESESVFYWLRGRDEQSEREYEELVRNQKDISSRERSGTMLMQAKEFCKKFVRRDFVIPCSIVFVAFLLLECSGRHYFPAYAPQIVEKLTGNKSSAFVYTLGLDLTITSSSIASSLLIRKMKRRTLLFGTGIAATVVLFMACLYVFLLAKDWIPDKFSWVALCLFVPYFALVNLGSTPIPLALLGEIFPMEHRATGSLVAGGIMSFGLWASMKAPPYMLANTNVYGTFFIFGVLQVIALFILYLILPETKDRTLEEIEYYFNKRCFKDAAASADEHKPLGAD